MLAHLRKDGANVQMDVRWVQNLKAIVYAIVRVMEIVILNFEGFFEKRKGRSQLFRSSENTCEIIVGYSPIFVAVLSQSLSLSQELKGHIKVFCFGKNMKNVTYPSAGRTWTGYCK
jgi:hypothetical protein